MQPQSNTDAYMGNTRSTTSDLMFPTEVSPVHLPWPVHALNPVHHDPFLFPPPPHPYGGLLSRRPFSDGLTAAPFGNGGAPFGLQAELQKMTAQEIMDAKALAASKSHSEAERRRRERINNHLAKLRSLLPSTTKTDKASLLAEVIQHVKELRRQTSLISETTQIPTETDELTVENAAEEDNEGVGKVVIRASVCCEDRSDLLPDLIKALKALRLRTLRAEITTVGGRVRNVLFVSGEEDTLPEDQHQQCCITSIHEALKAVMEKASGEDSSSGAAKRPRTNNINILEQQQH